MIDKEKTVCPICVSQKTFVVNIEEDTFTCMSCGAKIDMKGNVLNKDECAEWLKENESISMPDASELRYNQYASLEDYFKHELLERLRYGLKHLNLLNDKQMLNMINHIIIAMLTEYTYILCDSVWSSSIKDGVLDITIHMENPDKADYDDININVKLSDLWLLKPRAGSNQ
jgi:hypothetical protein